MSLYPDMKLFELVELDSNPENILVHAMRVEDLCIILDEATWFYHTLKPNVTGRGYRIERKDATGTLLTTYVVIKHDIQQGFITYVQK